MGNSAEQAEFRRMVGSVDQGIDQNHQIEQIRQELQNLNNTLELIKGTVEAVEQNVRPGGPHKIWASFLLRNQDAEYLAEDLNRIESEGWIFQDFAPGANAESCVVYGLFWKEKPPESPPEKLCGTT